MKKAVLVQVLLIVGIVTLGLFLKINPINGPRMLHKLFGFIAGLVGIYTSFLAYKEKHPKNVQIFAYATVLLTLSAGIGGSLLYRIPNYTLAYGLMVGSATLALITGFTLLLKVKK